MQKFYLSTVAVLTCLSLTAQVWQSQDIPFEEPLFGADVSVVDENVAWMGAWMGDWEPALFSWIS